MRVAIVGPFPRDLQRVRGGVEAVLLYLTEELKRFQDIDLHVVTLRGDVQSETTVSLERLTVHYLPRAFHKSYLTFYANKARLIKKLKEIAPDVIDAHEASEYAASALESGLPTVVTLHGIRWRELKVRSLFHRVYRGWHVARWERFCVRHAQHIISISPYIQEELSALITGRVYPIENPVAGKFFELGNKYVPNRVLFAGLIHPRKQVIVLLQAMVRVRRRIPTVELHIAGDGYKSDGGSYVNEVKELISKERLDQNVHLLGSLSDEKLLKEFESCSLLVLPSVQETAPMVVMQAMAAGKAVVSTQVGGIPFLVQDNQTGLLVQSGDVEALAEAMITLLKNDELREQMGQKAREEAEKRFLARSVAEKTREVLYEIADRSLSA